MKTGWTIIPAALLGLALLSEPVMLVPGSYFSGVGEAEYGRLGEAMNKPVGELRDNVARGRIGREIDVPASVERPAYLFHVRRDGHFLVRASDPSTALNVSYIEPGASRLRRATSSRSSEARLSLDNDALIYVEVRGAPRSGNSRSFEITEPLRHANIDARAREVVALGWDRWDFDPEALSVMEPGQSISGDIDQGGHRYYLVEAPRNAPMRISLNSDEFDPYLELWEVGPEGVIEEHTDDDGGNGNNSMIMLAPRQATSYLVIMARGYSDNGEGVFQLNLGQEEVLEASLGVTEDGYLTAGGGIFYSYDVGGRRVDIDLTSEDFDTYVEVWAVDSETGAFRNSETNDDGGEGQNSRLSFNVPTGSTLLVNVRGYSDSGEGRYELYVR